MRAIAWITGLHPVFVLLDKIRCLVRRISPPAKSKEGEFMRESDGGGEVQRDADEREAADGVDREEGTGSEAGV